MFNVYEYRNDTEALQAAVDRIAELEADKQRLWDSIEAGESVYKRKCDRLEEKLEKQNYNRELLERKCFAANVILGSVISKQVDNQSYFTEDDIDDAYEACRIKPGELKE